MVAVFVVATFITFILIDGALQWSKARKQKLLQPKVAEPEAALQHALAPEAVAAPTGLFLDLGHTWLSLEASGRSKIGVDAFAPSVMGRIDPSSPGVACALGVVGMATAGAAVFAGFGAGTGVKGAEGAATAGAG